VHGAGSFVRFPSFLYVPDKTLAFCGVWLSACSRALARRGARIDVHLRPPETWTGSGLPKHPGLRRIRVSLGQCPLRRHRSRHHDSPSGLRMHCRNRGASPNFPA
jgi:hypothetical protein